MPTYEFSCPNGHDFEKFYRTISASPDQLTCPTCGAPAQRRVSGGAGLVFKGTGFYITDYGKDGKKDQRDAAKAPLKDALKSGDKGSSSPPKSSSSE